MILESMKYPSKSWTPICKCANRFFSAYHFSIFSFLPLIQETSDRVDVYITIGKPKTLNHIEAAGLPLVGVSAWQARVENIGLSKDKKILIHGGAGGIGFIAIQLAKHLGAHIATTALANDKQFVQELGANQVIDYKTEKFKDITHGYDAVFDTVGGETYKRSFVVLKKGSGIIVSMLEQPNSELMNQYGVKAIFQFTQLNRERLTKLAEWVDQNHIKVNVDKTFSLDQAAKALDYQRDVHPRGKIVLNLRS